MLYEWAKTKQGQEEASKLLSTFRHTGTKGITVDTFLELGYNYITYKLEGRYYQGYFSKQQEDDLFKILNYYSGKIRSIN